MPESILIDKDDLEVTYENEILRGKEPSVTLKTKDKPILNYPTKDGTFVTFRESKAAFAPKPDEFQKLRKKIFRILGKKSTPEFDDRLSYLITFLREQIYINATTPSVTARRKELSRYKDLINNMINFMENDQFNDIRADLRYEIMNKMHETNSEDAVYTLFQNARIVADMCESACEKIKGQKRTFTPNTMRRILAEELARELDKMGKSPTKYRNGNYFKILRATLEMTPCTVYGERISIGIPQDLFKIAGEAIDTYPNKKPYSLLDFD